MDSRGGLCRGHWALPESLGTQIRCVETKLGPGRLCERTDMRQFFFMGILIFGVLAGIAYFCWSIIVALYHDWTLGRHVGTIKKQSEAERAKRVEEARKRLDNGCEHEFGVALGGFPPNACHKCGLEKQRPSGGCDHVWVQAKAAMPRSECKNCGKRYVSPTVDL